MKLSDILKKPATAALLGFIVGAVFGLVVLGWGLWPVQWTNAAPAQMGASYQDQYLRMAIDSYRVNPDNTLATQRFQALGSAGPALLEQVKNNPGSLDVNAIASFTSIVEPGGVPVTTTPTTGGTSSTGKSGFLSVAVIVGVVAIIALFGFLVFRYLIPLFRHSGTGSPTAAMRAHDLTQQTELTDYEAMGEEPPIAQFVTTYVLGDDLFDDSFSIDSPSGEFLGECGIGISETIGVGEPKKVQAFEVWLFDKNDIQTVTKVLMSNHAYNDVATFQRLQAKGEPIMVERGKQVVLETAALQLVATVSDMEFGQGALPEGSYFDRLTLEIAVWPKVVAPA